MIQLRGTGPQKRLSSDSPRLSPIMNQCPAGILMGTGRLHPPSQVAVARVVDVRVLLALAVAEHVPVADGDRVARLADDALDEVHAGAVLGGPVAAAPSGRSGLPQVSLSDARGRVEDDDVADARDRRSGCRCGRRGRAGRPARVGTIDSLGIRYGLTRKAWMPSARARAMTTMTTSSTSDPPPSCFFFVDVLTPCRRRPGRPPRPRARRRRPRGPRRPRAPPRRRRGVRLLVGGGVRLGLLGSVASGASASASAGASVTSAVGRGAARVDDLLGRRAGAVDGLVGGLARPRARRPDRRARPARRLLRARRSGARGRGRACRRGRGGSRAWRAARRRERRPRCARSSASAAGTCAPRRRRRTACAP